jgi:hypothetical protein
MQFQFLAAVNAAAGTMEFGGACDSARSSIGPVCRLKLSAQLIKPPFNRSWRRGTQKARPELLAVSAVVDPFARCCDPLAGRDGGGMANNGYNVTMPASFGAQYAKTILCIVIPSSSFIS